MCDCKIKCALAERSERQGSAKQVLISGSTLFKTRNNVLSSFQGGDLQSKYYRDLTGCYFEKRCAICFFEIKKHPANAECLVKKGYFVFTL